MNLFKKDPYVDKVFWFVYIALVILSIITIFSAASTVAYKYGAMHTIGNQICYVILGAIVAYAIQKLPNANWIVYGGYFALAISFICLCVIQIAPNSGFVPTINGAKRLIQIGSLTFQPSELAKLGLVITLSKILSKAQTAEQKRKAFFWSLAITLLIVIPILLENLSTALLIAGIVFILWVLASIPWKYTLSTVGIALLCLIGGYLIVEFGFIRQDRAMTGPFKRAETWVSRVDRYFVEDDEESEAKKMDPTGYNSQAIYSKVAIARGGLSPIGVLPGNSRERDYLPLAYLDYIFSIYVEELGIVGAVFLIALYLILLFRACYVSSRFSDRSSMLMVMGLALVISLQALIAMMVCVGIIPVTGQSLPLISRSGTGTLVTSVYFGIMMYVSREHNQLKARHEAAIQESLDEVPDLH